MEVFFKCGDCKIGIFSKDRLTRRRKHIIYKCNVCGREVVVKRNPRSTESQPQIN